MGRQGNEGHQRRKSAGKQTGGHGIEEATVQTEKSKETKGPPKELKELQTESKKTRRVAKKLKGAREEKVRGRRGRGVREQRRGVAN